MVHADGRWSGELPVSFMPSPGSKVRLLNGRIAIVVKVTPDGRDDRVRTEHGHEERVTLDDIAEIIEEVE